MTKSILCTVFTALCGSISLFAGAPAKIDVSKLPASIIEEVVVPVPSEVFSVLDKLSTPNWKEIIRPEKHATPADRPHTALLLGTVIADGFIAVQAQDAEQVKEIGRTVLTLASAIGVRKSVIETSNSIIQAADKKDWPRVRSNLDRALQDVREAMIELRDGELAQLVSLGGWLRGTEALTAIVQSSYSVDGAELLHQPLLVEYFSGRIAQMEPRLRDNALVASIQLKLAELKPLISSTPGHKVSPATVAEVHRITGELVKSIAVKQQA